MSCALLLSDAFDQRIVKQLGLVAAAYTGDPGGDLLALVAAPFTYQFLHANWLHLGVNMLSLAAFGAPVERVLGARRFVAFYLSAGLVAGLVHVLFFSDSPDPVIGASGAISGVFGAVLILMRRVGSLTSLLPIAGVWIALNIFFGLVGGTPGAGGEPVAWTGAYRRLRLRSHRHPPVLAAPRCVVGRPRPAVWQSAPGCGIGRRCFGGVSQSC